MTGGAKHKMYDYEVTPPTGTWDKINSALDEEGIYRKLALRLYSYEVLPPLTAWNRINKSLDEHAVSHELASTLYELEVSPPVRAWNNIRISLDSENDSPVPKQKRLSPILRYTAAAVTIGLLAWGGVRLLENKKTRINIASAIPVDTIQAKNAEPASTNNLPVRNDNLLTVDNKTQDDRNDAALEASKKTYAKLDLPARTLIRDVSAFSFAAKTQYSVTVRGLETDEFTSREEPQTVAETTVSNANRYIVLMTPEGNIVRMSKKLSNWVCCVSGEEQSRDCTEQMQKWRTQLACTEGTHSPANFMDILSLLSSLQNE